MKIRLTQKKNSEPVPLVQLGGCSKARTADGVCGGQNGDTRGPKDGTLDFIS